MGAIEIIFTITLGVALMATPLAFKMTKRAAKLIFYGTGIVTLSMAIILALHPFPAQFSGCDAFIDTLIIKDSGGGFRSEGVHPCIGTFSAERVKGEAFHIEQSK